MVVVIARRFRAAEFQSLSGFQVRCNWNIRQNSSRVPQSFNPYRVFKFVATTGANETVSIARLFQSLSGFQVRCNEKLLNREEIDLSVSIPIGFSSSLQPHLSLIYAIVVRVVSIPIGFSSSLQRKFSYLLRLMPVRFQSLSGFQVRCNIATFL